MKLALASIFLTGLVTAQNTRQRTRRADGHETTASSSKGKGSKERNYNFSVAAYDNDCQFQPMGDTEFVSYKSDIGNVVVGCDEDSGLCIGPMYIQVKGYPYPEDENCIAMTGAFASLFSSGDTYRITCPSMTMKISVEGLGCMDYGEGICPPEPANYLEIFQQTHSADFNVPHRDFRFDRPMVSIISAVCCPLEGM